MPRAHVLVVAAVFVFASLLLVPAAGVAAGVDQLIELVGSPQPPDERPSWFPADAWEQRRGEAWAQMRQEAIGQLAEQGTAAVRPLLNLMKTTDSDLVKISVLTVFTMTDPAALRPAADDVVALLTSTNTGVRYAAVKALGVMARPETLPAVEKMAGDESDEVRMAVADALGRAGNAGSVELLLDLMDDEVKDIRLHATDGIGQLGYARDSVSALIDKLQGEDLNERNAAESAIMALVGYNLRTPAWQIAHTADRRAPIIKALQDWWVRTVDETEESVFLIRNKPELTLRVNMLLQKWQALEVRLKAVEALARFDDRAVVRYMIPVLYERDEELRQAVAEAVSKLTGRKIEYLPTDTEEEWIRKVDAFKLWLGDL